LPGIKTIDDEWDLSGHRDRFVTVNLDRLTVFSRLLDSGDVPGCQARLPPLHGEPLVPVLKKLAMQEVRLESIENCRLTQMWDESRAKKSDLIRRDVQFPNSLSSAIYGGPHISVACPLAKTPRRLCESSGHYDSIDLTDIPSDYIPRTVFIPGQSPEYSSKIPRTGWGEKHRTTSFYRLVTNKGLEPRSERTLQPAIIPPEVGHIISLYSYTFQDSAVMLDAAATWSSISVDFLVKASGAGDFTPSYSRRMPILRDKPWQQEMLTRVCALNCLTTHYFDLWQKAFHPSWKDDKWAVDHPFLRKTYFESLDSDWKPDFGLRTDFERRHALVELDVLVAKAFGFALSELQTVLRVQFPVLRQNERDTWYDQSGRIVFTCSRGLSGVGVLRTKKGSDPAPSWIDLQHMSEEAGYTGNETVTQIVTDDTLPGGPRQKTIVYQAPWVRCDRERDYEIVWKHFAERFGLEGHS
jgi:hypothetical protein